MLVLQAFTRLNAGGPARMALDLLPRLAGEGVEALVACGACPAHEVSWEERFGARGIPVVRIPGLGKGEAGPARALAGLRRLIREVEPAVVHSHMARAGLLARLAARREGVPAVHTFHGHLFTGYFPAPVAGLVAGVERFLARRTARLVAVSARVAGDLAARRIGDPERVRVIPPGLELEPWLALPRPAPRAGTGAVGWAGRLVPVKDPGLFAAAARLLPAGPEPWRAAGGGPLLAGFRARAPEVAWLGHVADMGAFYAGLDLLVLTSRNEGLPLTLLEGLAAGVPILAVPVGGVPELLAGERGGVLLGRREPAALAAAVRDLLAAPARRAALGRAGRERARDFTAARVAGELGRLYREAAGGH